MECIMSKKSTAKAFYSTAAQAKARATVMTKKTGVTHMFRETDDGFIVLTVEANAALDAEIAAQLAAQAAEEAAPAFELTSPVAPVSGAKRDGGFVKQAVSYLHRKGVAHASQVTVKPVTNRKGVEKFYLVDGDKRLSWFPTAERAQRVLAAV
jgi:hypothetical protein